MGEPELLQEQAVRLQIEENLRMLREKTAGGHPSASDENDRLTPEDTNPSQAWVGILFGS